MTTFAYTARDQLGSAVNGTLVAESIERAGQMIRAEGKYPTTIRPADPTADAGPMRRADCACRAKTSSSSQRNWRS